MPLKGGLLYCDMTPAQQAQAACTSIRTVPPIAVAMFTSASIENRDTRPRSRSFMLDMRFQCLAASLVRERTHRYIERRSQPA